MIEEETDRDAQFVSVDELAEHVGETVGLKGWVYNARYSGKVAFVLIRDGTGVVQSLVAVDDVAEETWQICNDLTQESSVLVYGEVRADERAPGGFELHLTDLEVIQMAEEDFPLPLKEHGVDFLMNNRHLWLRMPKQVAVMRLRDLIVSEMESFLRGRGFIRVDTPILTSNACEGTTTLFEVDYYGEPAYLSQSGQLYSEATCAAAGKVYCLSPAFRAEKSKTRRHLIEFWILEPEMAYYDHQDNLKLQEDLVERAVRAALERGRSELEVLGRDLSLLERVRAPFPRITYDEALQILDGEGLPLEWGEDFGAPHEAALAARFDRPVFVERFPAETKAFYMEPDPKRSEVVLADDLLATEGYGEIIGGSQRINDFNLLLRRIREHDLPQEEFEWYLDLRRWGSVPHSGFGLGLERFVAWIAGLEHLREAIAFPRLLNRLRP